MRTPVFASIGAFGKIPSQGDFLRVHVASPACAALGEWLHQGVEALKGAGAALPSGAASFVFHAAGMDEVLVGSLAPSADSVGRAFPLAVFGVVEAASVTSVYPILPAACGRFFGATARLASAPPASAAELASRVQALPTPSAQEFSIAAQMRDETLAGARTTDFVERLFSAAPAGRQYYAFRTLVSACEPLRSHASARPSVTLDCPVSCDLDCLAWLELVRRLLSWPDAPPSLLWTAQHPSRLLVSLGPAQPSLLAFYAKADHGASSMWPLLTERADAIESAKTTLKPAHRRAVEGDLALEALFSELAG
jgi:type VI secretion system protein ImpM